MRTRQKLTIRFPITCLLVAAAAMSSLGCGSGQGSSTISEIRQKARGTLADIRSYHSRAEVVYHEYAEAGFDRTYKIVTESEVWVKGDEKYKGVAKTSGRENLGIPPTESVTILDEDTIASMGPDSIDIVLNNTPFDSYYRHLYLPFDPVSELVSLAEAENCSLLGSEEVGGRETFKVAIDRVGDEPQGLSADFPDREIMWVDRASSICWKKESYREGKLIEATDVIVCEVNADIPDSVFAIQSGEHALKTEKDMGYREIGIEEAEALCGFRPVEPAYLPGGFAAGSAGWRDPAASGLPLDLDPRQAPAWFKE